MDASVPSTLPTTVGIGVEETVELRADNMGGHTIGRKSSVVDLCTVLRSDMGLLNDNKGAHTRYPLYGAR